jgi:hypothetical protein
MSIDKILNGDNIDIAIEEQKELVNKLKTIEVFNLNEKEKDNVINFLCDKIDVELAIDYLFHVLDTEISYPVDEQKVKFLFSDDRMKKMKDIMLQKLKDDSEGLEVND